MEIAWHVHHQVLLEPLTEPIKNRIAYIKKHKTKREIKLRLRLLKKVKGKLPKEIMEVFKKWEKANVEWKKANAEWEKANAEWKKANAEWEKANAEWEKAYAEWEKANAERKKAVIKYADEINALHKKECPNCPWDSKTIFPAKEQK